MLPDRKRRKPVTLQAADRDGLFAARLRRDPGTYRLCMRREGSTWEEDDPYRFGPVLGEMDEHLLSEGSHLELWKVLGAHPLTSDGIAGVHFAVWAPSARGVSVVGDFNHWDGGATPCAGADRPASGRSFCPALRRVPATSSRSGTRTVPCCRKKVDPVGFGAEHPPATASIVRDLGGKAWRDGDWLDKRVEASRRDRPIAIYEAHLGSWKRVDGRCPSTQLPRAGRAPGALRARHGLHPHRDDAGLRAPLRRLLGLSAHRSLRTDQPPRHPRRVPRLRRGLPRRGPRPHPRLGTRPLPYRPARSRGIRRHGALRVRRPARGGFIGTGTRSSSTTPGARSGTT